MRVGLAGVPLVANGNHVGYRLSFFLPNVRIRSQRRRDDLRTRAGGGHCTADMRFTRRDTHPHTCMDTQTHRHTHTYPHTQ